MLISFLLLLQLSYALTPQEQKRYEQCVVKHRENLYTRNEIDSCEKRHGKNSSQCAKQYGEDYLNAVTDCKKELGVEITPEVSKELVDYYDYDSACDKESMTVLQSIVESCRSVVETVGSRCSRDEADGIISQASKQNSQQSQSMQEACENQKNFSQADEGAMRAFENKCGPAIMEGKQVCLQAERDVNRSKCPASSKANFLGRLSMSQNIISQHESTLSGARERFNNAKNQTAEAQNCLNKTKSTSDPASASASAVGSDPYKSADLGKSLNNQSSPAAQGNFATANERGVGGAPLLSGSASQNTSSGQRSSGLADVNTRGDLSEAEGRVNSNSRFAQDSANLKSAAQSEKENLEQTRKSALAQQQGALAQGGGGRKRTGGGMFRFSLGESNESQGIKDRSLAATSNAQPDLSQFLPHELKAKAAADRCAPKYVDGITGANCDLLEYRPRALKKMADDLP